MRERIRLGPSIQNEESCHRCGASGVEPQPVDQGLDRPLTLCAGCLAALARGCRSARRQDWCPRCEATPDAELTLVDGNVEIRVWCRVHRDISSGLWAAPDPRPLAVWSEGPRGVLYLHLVDGRWARATFEGERGGTLTFGPARVVEEDRNITRDLGPRPSD